MLYDGPYYLEDLFCQTNFPFVRSNLLIILMFCSLLDYEGPHRLLNFDFYSDMEVKQLLIGSLFLLKFHRYYEL